MMPLASLGVRSDSRARYLVLLTALVVVYVATGRLGLELAYYARHATLIWAPSGIAVAAL